MPHPTQDQALIDKHELESVYYEGPLTELKPKKSKFKLFFKISIFLSIFAVVGLTMFGNKFSDSKNKQEKNSWLNNFSLVGQLKNLAESSSRQLKGEERDRINILLLGIGGKNHDGGYLTDTIMIVSIKPSTKQVAMVSVPRDLVVPVEGYGWKKINSIGAYAEQQNPGSGGLAASQAISQLFNLPIDYYLRLDFAGFSQVIDDLGGVDVNVEHQLDDYRYPILGMEDAANYNSRYEHLHVEPGVQHMDGSLALKFARSRHGINSEGSDFARAKRQQLVIEAVKDKLFSLNTLFKPSLISKMITNYQEHVSTNLQIWEMVKLWDLSKDVNHNQIVNKVIDNGPGGLLVDARGQDGAYILEPKSGDFSQIQYLISHIFNEAPTNTQEKVVQQQAKIEIRNGTWLNGLASKASTDLEAYGFKVVGIGNASQRNFQQSVIYDLTNGSKSDSLNLLKSKSKANIALEIPQWLTNDLAKAQTSNQNYQRPDFVLVVGQSADNTASGATNSN